MDGIDITDFYPKYPSRNDDDFFVDVFLKKEFNENALEKKQEVLNKSFFKQQINISRFLSGYTPYNSLLVYHEMGVGKSCTAIATVEALLKNKMSNINKILIVTKNELLVDNFRKEIAYKCTQIKEILEKKEELDEDKFLRDRQKRSRIKKIINHFYEIITYDKFNKLLRKNNRLMSKKYEDSAIIIDEIHNLKMNECKSSDKAPMSADKGLDIYNNIKKFLENIQHKKLILLTGTPITDKISEIVSIYNLLLPIEQQVRLNDLFNIELGDNDCINLHTKELTKLEGGDGTDNVLFKVNDIYFLDKGKYDAFKNIIKGYTSYLSLKTNVNKEFKINKDDPTNGVLRLKDSNTYFHNMYRTTVNPENTVQYDAELKDVGKDPFSENTLNYFLGVYPDGSYGSKGFETYVDSKSWNDKKLNRIKEMRLNIKYGESNESSSSIPLPPSLSKSKSSLTRSTQMKEMEGIRRVENSLKKKNFLISVVHEIMNAFSKYTTHCIMCGVF